MGAILLILPDLSISILSAGRRCHEDYLVVFPQNCVHSIQLAQMRPVHEDVEVAAQITVRVEKMRFERRVPREDIIQQLGNGLPFHREFALVIDIELHEGGKTNEWHDGILLRVRCFYLKNFL